MPTVLLDTSNLCQLDDIVSFSAACRMLNVSRRRLRDIRATGRLKMFHMQCGCWLVRRSDVVGYLEHLHRLQAAGDRRVKRR